MGSSQFLLLAFLFLTIHIISCHSYRSTKFNKNKFIHERSRKVVNVDKYGTKGDGVTDDSKAFQKAWNETCSSAVSAVFIVPQNKTYLLKQLKFSGPCRSKITFKIKGKIVAPLDPSKWNANNRRLWIVFEKVRNLKVTGGGIIYGNGNKWWPYSCKKNETLPCEGAPTALTFTSCKNLRVENLRIKDSQQIHVTIEKSQNVEVSKLFIRAPENSPNTDGIHVSKSKDVIIRNCDIRTEILGDDCVSIVSESKNIEVSNIFCGPGHGISIGSLGKNNTKAHVSKSILNGTTNGVRIKTWQGGRGYAKDIVFRDIMMHNVTNPIIINQNYCDSKDPCHEQHDAVAIKNVKYNNIRGTSASETSVKFDCSMSHPCRGITLQDIDLVEEEGKRTKSFLNNVVRLTTRGKVVQDLAKLTK